MRDPGWEDWTWQMRRRVRSEAQLREWLEPTPDERRGIEMLSERFHFVITPYYASLMDPSDPDCPIRRQVVPHVNEAIDPAGLADPLGEVGHSPVKNVIRVYPDRIAFCVNNECALYCRFCLRKRMVGEPDWVMKKRELAEAIGWIQRTPEIRDVLLTGGDPLVFSDERLDWLLGELRAIPHVEIVRLGTRLPVTLPFRVTDALCDMLARHHPLWLNTHFNHPRELTPEGVGAQPLRELNPRGRTPEGAQPPSSTSRFFLRPIPSLSRFFSLPPPLCVRWRLMLRACFFVLYISTPGTCRVCCTSQPPCQLP